MSETAPIMPTYICVHVKNRLHSMREGKLVQFVRIWPCTCDECPINICKRQLFGILKGVSPKDSPAFLSKSSDPPKVIMVMPLG